jgi:hypothetical protein
VTERPKYPSTPPSPPPSEGKLFSDELLNRYSSPTVRLRFRYLKPSHQRIENWISNATRGLHGPCYRTGNGDLADVVKVLLLENEIPMLLTLAQHPEIPLAHLHRLSWGYSFGWEHLASGTLQAYIFFNVVATTPEFRASYKELASYPYLVRCLIESGDYDAQAIPHRAFFLSEPPESYNYWLVDPDAIPDVFEDSPRHLSEFWEAFAARSRTRTPYAVVYL